MNAANDDTGPLYIQRIAEELHSRSQSNNNSTNTISAVLVLVLLYQVFYWLDYPILPMSELLWNTAVHATPSRIISALESALLPTTTTETTNHDGARRSNPITHAQKSDTMRRVLGLDGSGILSRFQKASVFPTVNTLLQARAKSSPPGLGNWDNSCYQNSVLQGLASLPSFAAFLRRSDPGRPSGSTKAALREIIEKLMDRENLGSMFWTPAQLKSMSSWQQQDAQEYFSKLMDEVEKEVAQDDTRQANPGGLATIRHLSRDLLKSSGARVAKSDAQLQSSPDTGSSLSQLPDELHSIVARNPLEGLLAQRVGCLKCGFVEGLSLIPFNCLTLPLGKQWLYDIRSCLDDYTALEPINGVDCAKCTLLQTKAQLEKLRNQFSEQPAQELQASAPWVSEALKASVEERLQAVIEALDDADFSDNTVLKKCQISQKSRVSSTKTRQAVIARAPKSLAIHVNRSVFDETTGMLSKNYADVRFPLRFSLAEWCLGGCVQSARSEDGVEYWNTNPSESMLSDDINEEKRSDSNMYELRAALTHYGRHENGHYICYRRHERTPQSDAETDQGSDASWWRFSDEDVSAVSEDNVLAQGGVFMLFYERVNEPLPPSTKANPPNEQITPAITSENTDYRGEEDRVAVANHNHQTPVSLTEDEAALNNESGVPSDMTDSPKPPLPSADTGHSPEQPIPEPMNVVPETENSASETSNASSNTTEPPHPVTNLNPQPSPPSTPSTSLGDPSTPDPTPPPAPEIQHRRDDRRSVSHSMRTATPRSGRGKKGMEQVSSMVTAN
ncbi:MAG: hypothetical protein LQ345_000522 [Seirophora villosa]|nr:MAG: hypothetical protein LQ345_000522 [Seirophora villosa]